MKICTKCSIEQALTEFTKTTRNKSGLYHRCKSCQTSYRIENSEKIKKQQKIYRETSGYMIKWRSDNRERLLEYDKQRHIRDREKEKAYYKSKKEERSVKAKVYLEKNKARRREYEREYSKNRWDNDSIYKFSKLLRNRTSFIFKKNGYKKGSKSEDILGAPYDVVKKHIEKLFTVGMSWNKLGSEIHIDHKIPLYVARTEEDLMVLCHYRNLQPLWKKDNLMKSKTVLPTQIHLPV